MASLPNHKIYWLLVACGVCLGCAVSEPAGDGNELGGQTGDGSVHDGETGDGSVFGGQTGDGSEGPAVSGITAAEGDCNDESTEVDSPEQTVPELGFSANDLLTLVQEPTTVSSSWDLDAFTSGAPSDDQVTVAVEYTGGKILLNTQSEMEPSESASESGIAEGPSSGSDLAESSSQGGPCPPSMDVEVSVSLSTNDGSLNETFSAILHATSAERVTLRGRIEAKDVQGSLELEPQIDGELSALSVEITFVEFGSVGVVNGEFTGDSTPEPSIEPGTGAAVGGAGFGFSAPVLRFPADDDCAQPTVGAPQPGIVVTEETELQHLDIDDALTSFDALEPQTLLWSDGAQTTLSVEVEPMGAVCVKFGYFDHESLAYESRVTLSSADGRWDWSGAAFVEVSGGVGGSHSSLSATMTGVAADDAAEAFGLQGLETADAELLDMSLMLGVEHGSGQVHGWFGVFTEQTVMCSGEEPEGESCGFVQQVQLESASIGASIDEERGVEELDIEEPVEREQAP